MQIYRHFQTIYNKIVGKPLRVGLKRKALFISIALPLLSTTSVLLTHYVIRKQETRIERMFLFQVGPYCFLDTLTYGLGAYWYMCCEFLSHTARVMAENFQKVLFHVEIVLQCPSPKLIFLFVLSSGAVGPEKRRTGGYRGGLSLIVASIE